MGLTFFKNRVYPFESFWSIFQKVVHWNVCNQNEVFDLIRYDENKVYKKTASVLTTTPNIDHNKLANLLCLPNSFILDGLLNTYLNYSEIEIFSTKFLRFCPLCLSMGYHCIFNQIFVISKCLIHNIKLLDLCVKCNKPLITNTCKINYNYSFKCTWCRHEYYDFRSEKSGVDINRINTAYQQISDSLKFRKNLSPITIDYRGFNFSCQKMDLPKLLSENLLYSWKTIYGKSDKTTKVESFVISRFKKYNEEESINYSKEYSNFISKWISNKIGDHKKCIDYLGPKGWWMRSNKKVCGFKLCPVAHAYFLWRMFWEKKDTAHGLNFTPSPRKERVSLIDWFSPVENKTVSKFIFESELKMTFCCFLFISMEQFKENYIFFKNDLFEENIPFWEAYFDCDNNEWVVWQIVFDFTLQDIMLSYDNNHEKDVQKSIDIINRYLL